jgi:hypothetical protein
MARSNSSVSGATNRNCKCLVREELPSRHAKATQIGEVDVISRSMNIYKKGTKDPLAGIMSSMASARREY